MVDFLRGVLLAPVRRAINSIGFAGILVVLGVPIIAILAVLGFGMGELGISEDLQMAVGMVVGFGLLALVMGAFAYYVIDW